MLTPRLLRDFQKFFLIRRNPLNYNELRGFENGTQTGTRTQDQLVKSQLLYQLSYLRIVLDLFASLPFEGMLGGAQNTYQL